jgi:lipopolysaccharide export LptBFGC system permease protein LptF
MLSMKWQNEANAEYDESMQIIIHDEQLLADALANEITGYLLDDQVYFIIANELRNLTYAVQHGYLNYDGSASEHFNYNYDLAWGTLVSDMFRDYEKFRANSDDASSEAREQMNLAGQYLLATVFLAFGTVVAAAGISISNKRSKEVMLCVVAVIIISSVFYLISITYF